MTRCPYPRGTTACPTGADWV
uniref:Uncharacterized protein n=1 Tax=Anguilla anguilla TaxID=7936 RepID=A0A0E9PKE9_ANGAN